MMDSSVASEFLLYNHYDDGMPQTVLLVYQNANHEAPLLRWLDELEEVEPRAYAACLERIQQLERSGYELRRPVVEHLGDGVYELRAKRGRVHYRILYFFLSRRKNTACLTHGFTKEKAVPPIEIKRARDARALVHDDPNRYTAEWEV